MIRIITDTASDITLRQAAEMDIDLVSMRLLFGDEPYEPLADETFNIFYTMLEGHRELPVTSQPAVGDYMSLYAKAKQEGDEVLVITLSSGLSGTCQAARTAADLVEYDRVHVVDSLSAIMGQRLLVEYAVRMRKEGKTAAEMSAILTEAAGRIQIFGALDTLKYLRKGGRIPKTTEVLGSVMGIKPLIRVLDGKVIMAGKARGSAGAVSSMIRLVEKHSDFDPTMPVYYGYSKEDLLCRKFRKLCTARFGLTNTVTYPVGATIGTHVGPGGIAIAYLTKTRSED